MKFKIFTLYPQLFENFTQTSLIARGVAKDILSFDFINWREFGFGSYTQVDDRPFGGGSGMVLCPEPIFQALLHHNSLSDFTLQKLDKQWGKTRENSNLNTNSDGLNSNLSNSKIQPAHQINAQIKTQFPNQVFPNNADFYDWQNQIDKTPVTSNQNSNFPDANPKSQTSNSPQTENGQGQKIPKKAVIMMTPRGFPLDQKTCEWLSEFDELSILCGRFEGFDQRVNSFVDLEISVGNFVTNGGEMPAMCLIEAVSRLIDGFITKSTSYQHDSFSSKLNDYEEQQEFVIGKENQEIWHKDLAELSQIKAKLEQD